MAAEAGEWRFDLDLSADLPCFSGHFPDFAVLPGVVQIDWAMQLACAHLPGVPPAASDFRIKFKRLLRPGAEATLTLRHDAARRRLEFVYRSAGAVASLGAVRLPDP